MTDDLVFMMGKYEARIPVDRMYSEKHLWLKPIDGGFRVGFTAYSVRLLQDVYFLDWMIEPGTEVKPLQEIGEIESSKALSTLYVPFAGRVVAFNQQLLDDPSAINTDGYGTGWLYDLQTGAEPMPPAEYVKILDAGWEKTQRVIKGQIN